MSERPATDRDRAPLATRGRVPGFAARLVPATAAVLFAATPATIGPAAAQDAVVDAGSYELRVEDAVVGSEVFSIRREGGTYQGVGRHELSSAESPFRSLEVWLQADERWQPTVFRLQIGAAEPTSVLAVRDDRRFRVKTEVPEGDRWREFVAPPELVVLEPTAAHHYAFLLRQHAESLTTGEQREVRTLVPSRNEQLTLILRSGGREDLEWGGESVPTRRYDLTLGSERFRVWVHDDGRVLRVETPGSGSMVRTAEE